MPDTPRSRRWWFVLGMLLALAVIVTVLSAFSLRLRSELNEAQARLSLVETSRHTAEVAQCYASARGRPALGAILRVVAGVASDATDRAIIDAAIAQYVQAARTTAECDSLAREYGFTPSDFAPTAQREGASR